ncbi:MAG TPA: Asp-tRNA(Asn)/Glu-tRNA(Gln) amidotransferase subunit GatB [Planctomycetota bacterium]|nr:Asp-tRNA(Asn)/Glu-tRNA(Gln) amidotransferase subunit GatB [Planctomycetota bacterium]HRR83048.1 Asp-tRNA(Asn)/Glu-tRNA(Gln) amidotransferase subunit GatB [Planctomycetota bacterium]HRT95102.1 Asp-tRNA(Asn)/Glu-tRNA(Gln) amidotransferase subunit GatB [Planctomycetota bacterium]
MSESTYEVVIGLEAHAHLATKTKLFCGCSTRFGAPPNTQTCPVCTGHPGVLPVLNRTAFEHALKTALALNCSISRNTALDRKNYYYPDLPKNYQISQNYRNLGVNGHVDLDVGGRTRRVRIHNVHIEEDAGKLLHPEDLQQTTLFDLSEAERAALAGATLVDLNRAGTPLVEIVTEPDLRSVEEATVYMETLASMLLYLGVSDCKMQEGSLRFEASISLRPVGAREYGNRVEIKNVNSMKAVASALQYEARRQSDRLAHGEQVARETRLWDDAAGRTAPMRSKEEAQDYRYFPEPDLVPVEIDEAWLERVRASLPEMAPARRRRFVAALGLPDYDAGVLVADRALADYFESCVALGAEPKAASNWVMGPVLRELKTRSLAIGELAVPPAALVELMGLVSAGTIAPNTGKEVFAEMAATGRRAPEIIESRGLRQISDTAELESVVLRVLRENPKAAADLREGKKQAQGFLMGQVMKATRGKANPQVVGELIAKKLADLPA